VVTSNARLTRRLGRMSSMCWRSSRSSGGNEPLSSAFEALWLLRAYRLARSSIQNWISPS
jgi:hypothetical protein